MPNLTQGLNQELKRVRDLIKEYESLPDNSGIIGATIMKEAVKKADKAIEENDVVAQVKIYAELKGFE